MIFRIFSNKHLRCFWLRTTVVVAAGILTHASAAPPRPFSDPRFERTLVVGATDDSYPYCYLAEQGRCEGFAVDVLDAVARVMDLKIERVAGPGRDIQRRFAAGEFDFLQNLSQSVEREASADFSVPIIELQGSLFVRKDDRAIQEITDLRDKSILLIGIGSIGESFVHDENLHLHVAYVSSVQEALQQLQEGKTDAVFATRLTALSMIERFNLRGIRSLGAGLNKYEVRHGYAVHKGDAALLARLNEGLAILHRTGEFDEIYRHWFNRFDSPLFTRIQVISYLATVLGLACLAAVWGLLRQRALRQRLAGQATQLAENEAILAEAQRIAHVGHWHYEVDTRELLCSTEALRIMERDFSGDTSPYRKWLRLISPTERPLARRSLHEALLAGKPWDLILTLRPRADLRKFVHTSGRAIVDDDGRVSALFGTIQDITPQKTAEDSLRAREQLLLALYENVPSAMGVVEPSGESFRFVSANSGTARILGLNTPNLADKVLAELLLPTSTVEFWTRWFREAASRNAIFKTEHHAETTRRHYSITLVPLENATGGRKQLCFLLEDITERKQMDAEIAQGRRLRAVGELVGGIAHEFNNLLTPIMLKTEMLGAEWRQNPRMLEELLTISRAAQRGADLTRRLLAFGRRSEARSEEVHLHTMVRSNFDLLRPTIDRRIRLESSVPEKLLSLFLNPSDLHQIILNLLLNARDTLIEKIETRPLDTWHARIRVDAAEYSATAMDMTHWDHANLPRGWLCLTVRDNGMGMPREVIERIFEPFYTTKEVGKGTGLGLATVWHLVTRMGGKVTVDSTLGESSAFHVWLPVVSSRPGEVPAAPVTIVPTDKSEATILLVEDDELVAQTVLVALRRARHQVTHFANGTEAWAHLSKNPLYDILLLDLDLPGISGLEIARRAKAHHFPGKILVASGRLTETETDQLDELGVEGKLEKPFTIQILQAAVLNCLHSAHASSAAK